MAHIGARRPYLLPPHAGLGQLTPTLPVPAPAPATISTDPLYARILGAFGTPLVSAFSARIAGTGARGGGFYYPSNGGGSFGFAGISQSTLLFGALALGAVLIFSKR